MKAVWYAVVICKNDNDLGTGSYDYQRAVAIARDFRTSGMAEAHIVAAYNGAFYRADGTLDEERVGDTAPVIIQEYQEF